MEQFTREDLVTFGNYILSKERTKSISYKPNKPYVHHSDICNWLDKRNQEDIIAEEARLEVLES